MCVIGWHMYYTSRSTSNSCVALALWDVNFFGTPPTPLPNQNHPSANNRPVDVDYFAKVNVYIGDSFDSISFVVAHVSWYQPQPNRQLIGKPAEVWCISFYESFGMYSYLPVEYILCRCASYVTHINEERVKVIVPLFEM